MATKDFQLENHGEINKYLLLKAPSLWHFVPAAPVN